MYKFPESFCTNCRLLNVGFSALIVNELIEAHLLQANCEGEIKAGSAKASDNYEVKQVRYDPQTARLYYNENKYFAPITPELANFEIGGYKPLEKYLKSRKGRRLETDELEHLQKVANAIDHTIKTMQKIDHPN